MAEMITGKTLFKGSDRILQLWQWGGGSAGAPGGGSSLAAHAPDLLQTWTN